MLYDTKGISVVEILVVIFILGAAFFGIINAALLTFKSNQNDELFIKAKFLAEEGMEALRSVRDNNYWFSSDGLGSKSSGIDYYLNNSSARWLLVSSPIEQIGEFTRKIRFEDVYRDSNDNIVASGGSLDANSKKVIVYVSWNKEGKDYEVRLEAYLTNWTK